MDQKELQSHVDSMSYDVRQQVESIRIAISALAATPLGTMAFALAAVEVAKRNEQMLASGEVKH